MDDVYKPGAVSSLIKNQASPTEKSKEQKKLDKLFGRMTKSFTSKSIPQVAFNDVSKNLKADLKSSKKKEKSKNDLPQSDKEIKLKEKQVISTAEKNSLPKKKKERLIKEKKRNNNENVSSPSLKKTKKFKEPATEPIIDENKNKKGKKRKITTVESTDQNDDKSNSKKKQKLDTKNNLTNGTQKKPSTEPRQKIAAPVINDVLCALKETDGSKSRKRTVKKDLPDLEGEDEPPEKRRKKKKRDKTNDFRTVFVGNLPLSTTKKQLKKLFSSCGEVDNLRMRGAIPADPQRGKKYAILKKSYHAKCRSINAYICFVDKKSVEKACEMMNGFEVEGQHIRVNSSIMNKTGHDHKRSVFVGNLPFAISEEDVRNHFLDCGTVDNIRLVRDWKTGVGKGFGYVKFKDIDSAELAVKLDNSKLNNRKIRVFPSEADPKKRLADKNRNNKKNPGGSEKNKIKKSDQKEFVGVKAEKKKKKKPKHLARKMGLTTKKKDIPEVKPVEKETKGPNKHMVFE